MGKNKNKRRRYKQKKYSTYRIIGYVILAVIILAFIAKMSYESYINHLLEKQGLCTKAVVYERKKVGRKGDVLTRYAFIWKDVTYYGKSYKDTKRNGYSWFQNDYITGDTITIVFLDNDPDINKSNSLIKNNCECINANNKRQP